MSEYEFAEEGQTAERPTLDQAIVALKEGAEPSVDQTILYGLSDLSEEQLEVLKPVWDALDGQYRQLVTQILVDEMDGNFELNYDVFAQLALTDRNEYVRQLAIEILLATEDSVHLDTLAGVVKYDRAHAVRVAALHGMGEFLSDGCYEDLPPRRAERIHEYVQSLWNNQNEHADLRGAALEVLAATDSDITACIREAYHSEDESLRLSALVAMGYTADSELWRDTVIEELTNGTLPAQREAARAAGALELDDALPLLLGLLEDEEADAVDIVVWSLGEIGGKEALRVLNVLAESAEDREDDDLLELIEDAMGTASLADGGDLMRFEAI